MAGREPVQIENPYQALVRCEINSAVQVDSKSSDESELNSKGSVDLDSSIHLTKLQLEKSMVNGVSKQK